MADEERRDYDDCVRFAARLVHYGHAPSGTGTLVQKMIEERYSPRATTSAMASFFANNRDSEYWLDAFESAVQEQQRRMTGKTRRSK